MILFFIIFIFFCSYFLWKSCSDFDRYSKIIGYKLRDGVRGATINAIGSSLPELFTSLFFLFLLGDVIGFSAGIATILGSAVFNILVIPAFIIPILIKNKHQVLIQKHLIIRDAGMLVVSQIALLYFIHDGIVSLSDGFYLFLIYIVYISLLSRSGIFTTKVDDVHKQRIYEAWKRIVVDVIKISFWCLVLVKICELLGGNEFPSYIPFHTYLKGMNWDIMFIAIFIAAAASSIPDLFISIVDAKNGDVDDSIANPLASNLFDICISFGLPVFIYTLFNGEIVLNEGLEDTFHQDVKSLILIMMFLTVIFIISVLVAKEYKLFHSILFGLLYIVFIYSIFHLNSVGIFIDTILS